MQPDVRYARSGGAAIAYQVVGGGETDLVYVPDYVSNLVYGWASPYWRRFYDALTDSFRLILFDKRGTGLSDLGGHYPALETRMEDLHAVLDAAGSERAVLLGSHDGCSLAAMHAATYPERTRAIALFHPSAHAEGMAARSEDDERDVAEGSFYKCDICIISNLLLQRGKVDHLAVPDVIELIKEISPSTAILTHFGMTMLKTGVDKTADRIAQATGSRVIAAKDGMQLVLPDLIKQ
jgi:pimeloyl-ACP methyl ester carboxylesterase